MFKNNLKIAWRSLIKDRLFTFLNLIGLSTGLACAFLIYLWVTDERNIDKFNEKDNQLYQVMLNIPLANGIQTQEYTPGLLAKSLAAEIPEIEYAVSVKPGYEAGVLSAGDRYMKAMPVYVDKNFFRIFSYDITQGDKKQVLSDKYSVLISTELASKLFGSASDVTGRSVQWGEDSTHYTISGVFKKPANSAVNYDLMFTYQLYFDRHSANMQNWQNSSPATYILLKDGANAAVVNTKIAEFIKEKDSKAISTLFIRKFSDKYLYDKFENGVQAGGRIEYVRLFSIIAIFILVIACINFMNLSTAKASRRLKEVGIKKVAGASRLTLIFQYLGESMLMTFLSFVIALLLVNLLLPEFNTITQKHLQLHYNTKLVLFSLFIIIITGLVAGSYPAFYLSGFKPVTILKGKLNTVLGELLVRKGLVVFQFSLSVIFIISVLAVYYQMQLIQTVNLGYNKDNVVSFKNEGNLNKGLQPFLAEVRNMPDVLSASSFRGNLTGNHGSTENLSWPGKAPDQKIEFESLDADINLMEMLGFKMAEGRTFSHDYGADSSNIIFNETAVKAMGLTNPIGKNVKARGKDYQIIGVVKDFHFESLYEKVKPCFMRYTPSGDNVLVKIKAGHEKQALEKIRNLYNSYNPALPFEFRFLDDDYQIMYASEQRVAVLSRYFAGLTIIISCLGLFGLIAFTSQKRQKEIGIRKVVGATVGGIIIMLSKDFLKLILVSILIAFPVAWWITNQWLNGFAYRIHIGAGTFFLAGISIIFITLFTISFQAIKAAIANPVKSLRTE
jgi:putative ABC transport system permease protein